MAAVAAKLHIKEGMKLALLNPPGEHKSIFREVPRGCSVIGAAGGKADLVLLFATNAKELETTFPKALKFCGDDTPIWVGFPKLTGAIKSDLTRDKGWDGVTKAGYRRVSLIAVDDTWSAMRVRKKELVKAHR